MLINSQFVKMAVLAIIFGIIMIAFGGCATDQPIQPPLQPAVVTKLQLVKPSAILLADCDVKAVPPDPDTFAAKQLISDVDRLRFQLGLVVDYSTALQTDLKNCMAHPKTLRDWYQAEDALYPSSP